MTVGLFSSAKSEKNLLEECSKQREKQSSRIYPEAKKGKGHDIYTERDIMRFFVGIQN